MKTFRLSEAKAKLSAICEHVARSGQSMVITRRGRPLVRIEALPRAGSSVWEARASYIARKGRLKEEFELPPRRRDLPSAKLEE